MPKRTKSVGYDPSAGARIIRAPKTAEVLAHQIRRDIATGVLAEGTMLPPEHALQELFGVSRQTLREAFRILESERLISVQRGVNGGARVNLPEIGTAARFMAVLLEHRSGSVADLYEAKAMLELVAVKRLAVTRTKADVRTLRSELARHEEALHNDSLVWWGITSSFHSLLVERLRNETLSTMEGMIAHLLRRAGLYLANNVSDEARHETAELWQGVHGRVIDFIADKDPEGATAVWDTHNRDVSKTVSRSYGGQSVIGLVD
jgi:GntR family transcriptional regulator, transcriptional repressor for pyruvate dehydrogenase complex